jgi:hypothetical protein
VSGVPVHTLYAITATLNVSVVALDGSGESVERFEVMAVGRTTNDESALDLADAVIGVADQAKERARGYAEAAQRNFDARARRHDPPRVEGLCGDRGDHEPHWHVSPSLGRFWCHADQSRRLPHVAEMRRVVDS